MGNSRVSGRECCGNGSCGAGIPERLHISIPAHACVLLKESHLHDGIHVNNGEYTATGGWPSPSLPKLPSHPTISQKLTSSTGTAVRMLSGRDQSPFSSPARSLVYLLCVYSHFSKQACE